MTDGRDDAPAANAVSVDVEDYYQVWALSSVVKREDWDAIPPRVDRATRAVLDLFDRTGAKGTFFTLGVVAQRHPDLVRDIVSRGHEVGSHGWDHAKTFDLSADAFRDQTARAKGVLEDIGGVEAAGYRAAGFSFDDRTPWAWDVLREAGHRYSSSVHPIAHDHYSAPDAPLHPYAPIEGDDAFLEIPVAVAELAGRRFSCAGGGRFRLWPTAWTRALIDRVNASGRRAVFYFHPWEVDPGQPRVEGLSAKSRFRQYVNLGRMEAKLERLLSCGRWDRIDRTFGVGSPGLVAEAAQ